LLCLDAPLVALGWALLLSPVPEESRMGEMAALFLAVWIIYLGDRFFDSLRPDKDPSPPPSERLAWARSHRKGLVGLLLFALAAISAVAGSLLPDTVKYGGLLASATALYYALFRNSRIRGRLLGIVPAKELAIGIVFALGATLAARGGEGLLADPGLLLSMVLLFAGNCLIISRTEALSDQARDGAAYYSGAFAWRHLPELFFTIALVLSFRPDPLFRGLPELAVVASSAANLVVSRIRRGNVPQALADALLLAPWLFLLWHWGA